MLVKAPHCPVATIGGKGTESRARDSRSFDGVPRTTDQRRPRRCRRSCGAYADAMAVAAHRRSGSKPALRLRWRSETGPRLPSAKSARCGRRAA